MRPRERQDTLGPLANHVHDPRKEGCPIIWRRRTLQPPPINTFLFRLEGVDPFDVRCAHGPELSGVWRDSRHLGKHNNHNSGSGGGGGGGGGGSNDNYGNYSSASGETLVTRKSSMYDDDDEDDDDDDGDDDDDEY